jgi:NO-binding membrane sensor protein with MHYT domain
LAIGQRERRERYARFRFAGALAITALAGLFFVALTASRLFFRASIRFTTRGGASRKPFHVALAALESSLQYS